MDQVLNDAAQNLLDDAKSAVLRVNRATGFPVFLVRWADLSANDAVAWWTTTGLAVIRVARGTSNPETIRRRICARLALLEQYACGLPMRVTTEDENALRLSEACATTAGLIRSGDSFSNDLIESTLSDEATAHLAALKIALAANNSVALVQPFQRLAALLVASGLRGACTTADEQVLARKWSKLRQTVNLIRHATALTAANAAWKWATRGRDVPNWIMSRRRNVDVSKPRVRVLGTTTTGVLASDETNAKGFRFTESQLSELTVFTLHNPVIYTDHDRSIPPAILALDATLHSHGSEGHYVSVLVAARSKQGEARLERGGGFSVGLDVTSRRKK